MAEEDEQSSCCCETDKQKCSDAVKGGGNQCNGRIHKGEYKGIEEDFPHCSGEINHDGKDPEHNQDHSEESEAGYGEKRCSSGNLGGVKYVISHAEYGCQKGKGNPYNGCSFPMDFKPSFEVLKHCGISVKQLAGRIILGGCGGAGGDNRNTAYQPDQV